MTSSFAGRSALVTGASAGLGEEFARQLARMEISTLYLTARRDDRLQQLKKSLESASLRVEVFVANLADPAAVTQLVHDLNAAFCSPDILINNAGLGDLGNFESSEPEKIEAMMAVNMVALTRLTRWAIAGMIARKCGWVCNVGSSAGILPLPTFAVYAATKAYVNSFSEALRVEVHTSGIKVLALCPGPIDTEFGEVASRSNSSRKFSAPRGLAVTKEEVVRQSLAAMLRGQGRLIPGWPVRISMLIAESTPRCLMRGFMSLLSGRFAQEKS